MQIKTIHYSSLINLGNYSNERIGFTAQIEDGESIEETISALRQKAISNASLNADKVRNRLYDGREKLEELERKIQKATDEWNRLAEFLRTQGIKPDAPDMPNFSMLLPEVTEDHSRVTDGEIVEDEDEEDEDQEEGDF